MLGERLADKCAAASTASRVTTWVTPKHKAEEAAEREEGKKTRPTKMAWCATVFHISQTDPIG
jgi:hypothetical protein